jgi:LuxR family transcriptional regulator, maltose regulon positive regulatory protein
MNASQTKLPQNNRPLLHTKLMPPRIHSNILHRGDLLLRLDSALTRKITIISAPTGYGKTTLVSAWIASREFTSAWFTLDENDNDPVRFWTYVISALRSFDSSLGKTTLSMLTAPQPSTFHSLLTPLVNDLTHLKGTNVFVMEDYHSITTKEINDGVSFLIQHLPESLHLVLITRTEPDIPLPILRARDETSEINMRQLRFNREEVETFLEKSLRFKLSPETLSDLLQRTDCWVAGLQLVVLSLQNNNKNKIEEMEKLIQSFSGKDHYVADYLIGEVFEGLPKGKQSFLLKTCFFERLTGNFCDAITDMEHSAAILQQLERDNLFITQLEQGGDQIWYRYNHLFAEAIQGLARQHLSEPDIQSLFEKACDWYEQHGLYGDAIETAITAKLFERTMSLIEEYIEFHDLSEMRTLSRWLESMPQSGILLHPVICFAYAQILLYTTDRFAPATAIRIEPYLRAAESVWQAEENHQRLGELLSFRALIAWWQVDFQKAFHYAHLALNELPESDVFWRGNSLLITSQEAMNAGRILDAQGIVLEARALLGAAQNIFGVLAATQMLAEIFYWQGAFEQAEQLNRQILAEAIGDESMLDDQGIACMNLALIVYERNDLEQAEQFAMRARDLAEQRANEMLQVQTAVWLARIHSAKGDTSSAREFIKSPELWIQNPSLLREIQNAEALLAIQADDVSSLDWWVKIVSEENQKALQLQKEHEAFILARLKIMEGKPNEALASLKEWKKNASQNGRIRSQVEALCLESLAYHANSDLPEAASCLTEALAIGQARGFCRIFLDAGTRMAALLQAMLPMLPNRTLNLFATTVLHSLARATTGHLPRTSPTVPIDRLSPQELRVLRLLSAGLSNADIAQQLVVSTNTIKTQVKSIYRKLNVKSRAEAGTVARELRLL